MGKARQDAPPVPEPEPLVVDGVVITQEFVAELVGTRRGYEMTLQAVADNGIRFTEIEGENDGELIVSDIGFWAALQMAGPDIFDVEVGGTFLGKYRGRSFFMVRTR